jgi:hypothetical protein
MVKVRLLSLVTVSLAISRYCLACYLSLLSRLLSLVTVSFAISRYYLVRANASCLVVRLGFRVSIDCCTISTHHHVDFACVSDRAIGRGLGIGMQHQSLVVALLEDAN